MYRKKVIGRVSSLTFQAMLSDEVRCVNWPADGQVGRIMFDPASDNWIVQIESNQFDSIPEFQAFPEYELMFRNR
jgi:hypothetical protein